MLDVLAIRVVRFMMGSCLPLTSMVSSGKSISTSAISFPRSVRVSLALKILQGMTLTSAADIDNDVGVRELGQRLTDDSLAASKSTRNTHSSTLNTGKKGVKHTLADDERPVRRKLLGTWARHTNRPLVHHAVFGLDSVELELQNLRVHGVAALVCKTGNGSLGTRRQHDLMVVDQTVLENTTEDISAGDVVSDLVCARGEVPLLGAVESGDVNTAGNVDAVRRVGNALERALDAVVDGLHETRAELDGEGLAGPHDRIADRHTSCLAVSDPLRPWRSQHTSLFVDLDGGLVGLNSNDLTNEAVVTNAHLHSASIFKYILSQGAHTSSYIAHPIMLAATMTGLQISVPDARRHCSDVPRNGVDGSCVKWSAPRQYYQWK
jgi:hypothetical protein